VGAGATVLPGVRIGEGAKIAAGSTIYRNVAAGETVIFDLKEKKR
jgi:acetyltransferase-like isoleucine patch superfamily enzyme